jgi:hypothetical protein
MTRTPLPANTSSNRRELSVAILDQESEPGGAFARDP